MARSPMNLANSDVSQTVESELPTGTVTFLLTDIEGSTRGWEAQGELMGEAVARHYRILDSAITRQLEHRKGAVAARCNG